MSTPRSLPVPTLLFALTLLTAPLLAGCMDLAPPVKDASDVVTTPFEDLLAGAGKVYAPTDAQSSVRLKMLTPADPTAGLQEGEQTVRFLLYDEAANEPITDATVTLKAKMPSMGHGTGGLDVDPVHEGGGVYEGSTNWIMVGAWRLDVDVDLDDGTALAFAIDVQVGAAPSDDDDEDHDLSFASFSEALAAGGPVFMSGSGDGMLHLKLLHPVNPGNVTKGKQDVAVLLYEGMGDEATAVTDATVHLESWMPPHDMDDGSTMPGHGAAGEEHPVHTMHGVYVGATNHAMNGTWWTYLNVTVGDDTHTFNITFHVGEGGHDHHDHHDHHEHHMPANFSEAFHMDGLVLNATNGTEELFLKVLHPHDPTNATKGVVDLGFLLYVANLSEGEPGDHAHDHAPVMNATVEIDVHMHMHGGDDHHSDNVTQPVEMHHGIYVGAANLTMDGKWSVHIDVTTPEGLAFSFRLHLHAGEDAHDHEH